MPIPQDGITLTAGRALARPSTSLAPRILILGGGFAGVTTALELAKRCAGVLPVHITLLSGQNFFLFTPILAEAATGAVESRHVLYPIRPLCGKLGIEFGEMFVEAIDLDRRRVTVRHRRSEVRQHVHYDKLVLALGATPNVDMVPGAAENALTFKGVGDAVHIRNRVSPAIANLPLAAARDGRLLVNEFFEVKGAPDVYALGDNAAQTDTHTGTPYVATAQVAIRQARALARQIEAELTGHDRQPFRFRLLGEMVPLSRRTAVADLRGIKLLGFPAWFLWKTVYMLKLPTLAARVRVVLDWTVELFFERDVSELTVEEERDR